MFCKFSLQTMTSFIFLDKGESIQREVILKAFKSFIDNNDNKFVKVRLKDNCSLNINSAILKVFSSTFSSILSKNSSENLELILPDFDEVTLISLIDILTEGTTRRKTFLKEDIHEIKCLAACFGIDMKNLKLDPQDPKIEPRPPSLQIRSLSRHFVDAEVPVVDLSDDEEIIDVELEHSSPDDVKEVIISVDEESPEDSCTLTLEGAGVTSSQQKEFECHLCTEKMRSNFGLSMHLVKIHYEDKMSREFQMYGKAHGNFPCGVDNCKVSETTFYRRLVHIGEVHGVFDRYFKDGFVPEIDDQLPLNYRPDPDKTICDVCWQEYTLEEFESHICPNKNNNNEDEEY